MGSARDYSGYADDILIRLIALGQNEALDELYERYHRLVYGVALHMLGQERPAAEEVTLDVFVNVWKQAKSYRPDRARVSTWLASITRYRSIDRLRRRKVRPEGHLAAWDVLETSAAEGPGPEISTELALQREQVRGALSTLPPEQRQALALAYYGGYTQSEIASALDLPLGTVKTRIRLGMAKLRDLLQGKI